MEAKNERNSGIMVSVCMITYKHEKFIAEAIEGVLMQKCDFNFELVIGIDASKDKTEEICKEFQKKYPETIKLIINEVNIGMIPNLVKTMSSCNGKYIAFCEGDDFWIRADKLQKQVDFLEKNLDYTICFHAVNILAEGKEQSIPGLKISPVEQNYTINDLALANIIHTPSVIYRNILNDKYPEWFEQSPLGDYVLHMLYAKHGKVKYFPEVMAVYRIHDGGTFSSLKQREILLKSHLVVEFLLKENFDEEVLILLKDHKRRYINELLELSLTNLDLDQLMKDLSLALDDNILTKEWLTKRLPEEIKKIRNSGSFKWGQKLSSIYKFVRFK